MNTLLTDCDYKATFLMLKRIKIFDYKFPGLKMLQIILYNQEGDSYLRLPKNIFLKSDSEK